MQMHIDTILKYISKHIFNICKVIINYGLLRSWQYFISLTFYAIHCLSILVKTILEKKDPGTRIIPL